MVKIFILILLGFQMFLVSERAPQQESDGDFNLARIRERIARSSAEELEIIEKAKSRNPIIQKYPSAKTLGEIVDDLASGRGQFMIYPIGWEAVKDDGARWRITLHYQDEGQKYRQAIWGFNEAKNMLYPLELNQATKFWVKGKTIYP